MRQTSWPVLAGGIVLLTTSHYAIAGSGLATRDLNPILGQWLENRPQLLFDEYAAGKE
jgi:hypothetical protein